MTERKVQTVIGLLPVAQAAAIEVERKRPGRAGAAAASRGDGCGRRAARDSDGSR